MLLLLVFGISTLGAMIGSYVDQYPTLVPQVHKPMLLSIVFCLVVSVVFGVFYYKKTSKTSPNKALCVASIPGLLLLLVMLLLVWCNVYFDRHTEPVTLHVSDTFIIVRNHGEHAYNDKYIVCDAPEHLGNHIIWFVQRWVNLDEYPIGKPIKFVHHDGFLGRSWSEYQDENLQVSGTVQKHISKSTRGGVATSASGHFSPNSPFKQIIASWDIPLTDQSEIKMQESGN